MRLFRLLCVGTGLVLASLTAQAGSPSTLNFTKAFGSATIPLNGSTSLTFSMQAGPSNGNNDVGNFAFTDTLPAGLVVAAPNGLTSTACLGGAAALTATSGTNSIAVTNARVASNTTCTVGVNVTGTTVGAKANSVTAAGNIAAGSALTANATLTVLAAALSSIPAMDTWAMLVLIGMLVLFGTRELQRRS